MGNQNDKKEAIKDATLASVLFQNIIKASVKDNPKPKEKKTKAKK